MPAPRDPRPPASRVARNTAVRAAAEIVGKLASVVLFAYIARELGQNTLGEFVFALALAQIVWAVAGFGLDRMALRDVAREREVAIDRLFYDITAFKLAAGTVGVAISTAAVALLGYSGQVQALVAILGISFVIVLASSSAATVFQAYERMEYYFYAAVPNKILAALLGIAVLAAGGGIVGVAIGNLVAAVLGLVLAMVIMYRRFARPAPQVRIRRWAGLVRQGGPFGLQEVFGQIIFRMDIVLLSALTTTAVVGEYGAGYRLIEATLFLAWSVGTSVLPMYSYLQPGDEPSLERVFEGSLKFMSVILVPLGVVLLVCAEPIIDLIYGLPAYDGTVPVLRWLAFATVAYGFGHLAGILVLVRRPGRLTVIAVGCVAVVSLAINVVLISAYEAEGAAVATLATEVLLAGVSLVLARPVTGFPRPWRVLGAAGAAGVVMAGAMAPVSGNLALALPIGVAAYALVLVAVEARSLSGDLAAVRSVLRRPAAPISEHEGGRAVTGPRALRVLELFEAADGGVPEHVRRLSEGLAERGQHVTVSGPAHAPLRPVFEQLAGGFVPISMVGAMVAPRDDARALATAVRLIRPGRFDLVHVHGLKPALIGRAVAIARRVPVIYTPHCFIYRNIHLRARRAARQRELALLGVERLLGRGTAAVVAVASEERDAAVRDRVVPAERAHVVHNGVAPDTHAPADPRLTEFRGDGPLMGLVAGLRDQKGLPTLLDALELLAARGAAPRFAIVGNGPMAQEVRERVASGPLAQTTIVLAFEDRPEPYLAALDAFVLPSYWEGLPIAVLEAMAMGLPVVATAVGGTPEAVSDGRTGYLVPPRDAQALAASLEALAGDRSLAARMGEAGREEVRRRFGVERMVEELLRLYRVVADESPVPGPQSPGTVNDPGS